MNMARVSTPFAIQDELGNALSGDLNVYQHGTLTQVSVYAAETGGSALTQPISFSHGRLGVWVDEGSYDLVISTGSGGYTQSWEASIAGAPSITAGTKIVWQNAGTVFAELWADVTQAGLVLSHSDDFSTNTTSLYSPFYIGDSLPLSAWDSVNQWINPAGGIKNPEVYRPDWGTSLDTGKTTIRCLLEGPSSEVDLGFGDNAPGNLFYVGANLNGTLIFREMGGTALTTTLVPSGIPISTWLRMEVTRNGNSVHITVTREDTNVVLYNGDVVLQSANQPHVGAGTNLYPWFLVTGDNAGGRVDDFSVYDVEQESRDLYVRITPASGGPPITKRVFGIQGPTTQRTDF